MKREQHWATRALHAFLLQRAAVPFQWGVQDCALFAADGILAMTGVDIAAEFRGKYHDQASAMATIEAVTGVKGGTVVDAAAWCAARHGLKEWKHPLMAQRGDLAVIEDGGNVIAALVHLSGRHYVAAGEAGLKRILLTETRVLRAWKV
jgi:hypothetical protein